MLPNIEGIQITTPESIVYSLPSDNSTELNYLVNKTIEGSLEVIKKYMEQVKKKIEKKKLPAISLTDTEKQDLQEKISSLIKYYNELHKIFIDIYNEENKFSKEIKAIIPDASLILQDDKSFEEYKVNITELSIEHLLYLANKLLIYIEQLISETERILNFNKKYTKIIEELRPILDKF